KQCNPGTVCSSGSCTTSCGEGLTKCGNACIDTTNNPSHCGVCNNSCIVPNASSVYCANSTCYASACNSGNFLNAQKLCTANSLTQCGSVNNNCTTLAGWSAGSCNNGVCQATNCKAGYHLESHVCVADSATACGQPAVDCTQYYIESKVETVACIDGECKIFCKTGYGDCDGDLSTGCETSLIYNDDHCGGCGNACTASKPNCDGITCV
ncbi:MAG: hypothetical protein WC966_10825, partial [Bradymonadales bacterium]